MARMYFKSADPAKLAAWDAHQAAKVDLKKRCEAFAQQFLDEGQNVSTFVHRRGYFVGACFSPRKPLEAWTAPCKDLDTQRPRAALKGRGFTKEQKAAHEALRKRWDEGVPRDAVTAEDLFEAITGTPHDFFHGMHMFVHDGVVYVSTEQMPATDSGLQEIYGSEFNAAKDAYDLAEREKRQAEHEAWRKQEGPWA